VPFRVLIVKTDQRAAGRTEERLLAAGYHVTGASSFEEGRRHLLLGAPDLLITDLRLGAHNGVHLLIYSHASRPEMPGIVLDVAQDRVLEKEVQNAGGVYVGGPCSDDELLDLVDHLAKNSLAPPSAATGRESRKTAALSVNAAGVAAKVVNASYGGLRLELPGRPSDLLPRLTALEIPSVGRVTVRPVWTHGAPSMARWWCGLEIVFMEPGSADAWRAFVDSLKPPAVDK